MNALLSSWPEWLACGVTMAAILLGRRFRSAAVISMIIAFAFAWFFGSAKCLLLPMIAGGLVWIASRGMNVRWKRVWEIVGIAGVVAAGVLCVLFPVPVPMAFGGKHRIGTYNFELPVAGVSPRLLVQVWYPSDAETDAKPEPWLPDPELAPAFPFHRFIGARSRARKHVPVMVSNSLLPVLFYEHAWQGHRAENMVQVQELASRGFVVVAVDHPGQAQRVRYADGSVVKCRDDAPFDLITEQSAAAFEKAAERCFAERQEQVERVRLALKQETPGELRGRLNLDRVGVFGFSFGGSSAMRICAINSAFYAGANEDGLVLGSEMPRGSFLFFDDEVPAWLMAPAQPGEPVEQAFVRKCEERVQEAMRGPERERVIIDGTRHLAFSDRIHASPIPRLARVGTRSAHEVDGIVIPRLDDFFRKTIGVAE